MQLVLRFVAVACVVLSACAGGEDPPADPAGSGGSTQPGGGGGTAGAGEGGAGGTGGTSTRCGDGSCTAGESCATCPGDCVPEGLGQACSAGRGACERTGTMACAEDGGLACDAVPGEPGTETCNGIDDDCDGTADEDIPAEPCDTGKAGICMEGELRCRSGELACMQVRTPGTERCNALDDDCDGARDEGCPAPDLPRTLAPWIGEAAGSRPTFTWRSSGASYRYEIQLDDSCPVEGWKDCSLPSPEVDELATGTSFTPAGPLPVSSAAPVGARYVWRVVECSGSRCALSSSRYLDVGRQRTDFDGDGHADLLAGAPGEGLAYVLAGSAAGFPAKPSATLGDGQPGTAAAVAAAGDVNADGYADALVGADRGDAGPGSAWLLLGGPGGLSWEQRREIPRPADAERFGAALAAAGDLDADGYADVIVGAPGSLAAGRVYVYRGGASGLERDPVAFMIDPEDDPGTGFAEVVSGAGDLDPIGGTPDVIVVAPASTAGTGKVYVWYGDHLEGDARFVTPPPNQIEIRYNSVGTAAAVQRPAGDDAARVLLGAPDSTSGTSVGALVVLTAASGGTASTAGAGGFRDDAIRCGSGVAVGDVDGDGADDTVMACENGGEGLIAWQLGPGEMGAGGTLAGTLTGGGAGFGAGVAMLGDVDGDGRHDLAVAQPGTAGGGSVHVYRGGAAGYPQKASWTVDNPSGVGGALFGGSLAGGVR